MKLMFTIAKFVLILFLLGKGKFCDHMEALQRTAMVNVLFRRVGLFYRLRKLRQQVDSKICHLAYPCKALYVLPDPFATVPQFNIFRNNQETLYPFAELRKAK